MSPSQGLLDEHTPLEESEEEEELETGAATAAAVVVSAAVVYDGSGATKTGASGRELELGAGAR